MGNYFSTQETEKFCCCCKKKPSEYKIEDAFAIDDYCYAKFDNESSHSV